MECSNVSRSASSQLATATSVWFAGPRAVELRDEPLPPPGPREVQVRAILSAISHGTEMLVYRGSVPPQLPLDLPTLRGGFGFPIKYGYASVGRVSEAGAEVVELRPGDLVFTHHPHQTEYVVDAAQPVRLDPATRADDAVFLANLETAVNVLLDAAPRLGDRVAVLGQGVVGLLVTQLLRRAGAACVIAVEPVARRRELALRCGAHLAVSPAEATAAVREATSGVGVDLAIEASGSASALAQGIELVAFQATVVVCSWYGAAPVPLPLGGRFHRGRVRLVSSQVSNLDPALQPRWDRRRRLGFARSLLTELELASLISHRFPIQRAAEAYALIDERGAETAQVVIEYD
jgi:2-desacetyl-2-hydroxyethyl bacteriochlorophyllide A dehydrogenase